MKGEYFTIMNDLMIFNNSEFGEIRTVTINGEPWFVGKDIAEKLGYAEPRSAISKKVDEEDRGVAKMETPSGIQEMTIINESGLYSLVLSSKLDNAKRFKRWITSEVIPSIRKTGSYHVQNAIPFNEQVQSLEAVASILNMNEASRLLMLETFYKQYNVPTDFLPKYELNGNKPLKALSKLLKDNECDLSAKSFNILLLNSGYLEIQERPSSKGEAKKFKALTEKGLKYGENAISPHNMKEVQPLYYADTFMELYKEVVTE